MFALFSLVCPLSFFVVLVLSMVALVKTYCLSMLHLLVIARALCVHDFLLCVLCCAVTAVLKLCWGCGVLGCLGIESRCKGNIFMVGCSQKSQIFI